MYVTYNMINQINHKCILPQFFFEKYVYWKEMRKWFERERERELTAESKTGATAAMAVST